MQEWTCLSISMPRFIIVCSFFSGTMLLSNPSLRILFSFFGKVLGYFPFTSVSSIIYKRVFSAWWKSVLLVFSFLFSSFTLVTFVQIKRLVQVRTYFGSHTSYKHVLLVFLKVAAEVSLRKTSLHRLMQRIFIITIKSIKKCIISWYVWCPLAQFRSETDLQMKARNGKWLVKWQGCGRPVGCRKVPGL